VSLNKYADQPQLLKQAIETWKSARRHFLVTLSPSQIRRAANAKLASLPPGERAYWRSVLGRQKEPRGSLTFLALSLDPSGKPIRIVNTDVATGLFLEIGLNPDSAAAELAAVLRPYPVGLFVEGLGPLVANDAYAPSATWKRFENDQYHGPRVVWGREVNLLFLGLANQINSGLERTARFDPPMVANGVPELAESLQRLLDGVNESALQHNELWSYEIKGGKLTPVRYGTSSDVQLWNTTNLVVQYVLSQLPKVSPPRKW
jgi:hypothetical protein